MAKMDYSRFNAEDYSRKELEKIYHNMAAALNMRMKRSSGDAFEEITDNFQNILSFKERHKKFTTKDGNIKRTVSKTVKLGELRTITEIMADMLTENSPKKQARELEKTNDVLSSRQKTYIRNHFPDLANRILQRKNITTNDDYFDKDGSPDIEKPGGEKIVEKYYDEEVTIDDINKAANNIQDHIQLNDTSFDRMHVDSITGRTYYLQDDGTHYYPD